MANMVPSVTEDKAELQFSSLTGYGRSFSSHNRVHAGSVPILSNTCDIQMFTGRITSQESANLKAK